MMTFPALEEKNIEERWISSLEASHAKTSATQARVQELRKALEAVSGSRCSVSLAKYDLSSFSWKTCQLSLAGDFVPFSEDWLKQGMIVGTRLYRLPMSEQGTGGNDGSVLVGETYSTPLASDTMPAKTQKGLMNEYRVRRGRRRPQNLRDQIINKDMWPTPNCSDIFTDKMVSSQQKEGSVHSVTLSQKVLWPTPQAADSSQGDILNEEEIYFPKSGKPRKINKQGIDGSVGLARYVRIQNWPTPRAGCPGSQPNLKGGKILEAEARKTYPTPCETMSKGSPSKRLVDPSLSHDRLDEVLEKIVDNKILRLNPTWVEWLMGIPENYTDISKPCGEFIGWENDPADCGGTPRVCGPQPYRIDRLKALGNAVVPQQVVEAWRRLVL
jgi:hypothetical protein